MNKNVNVFIAVVLCALLCGGFVWLRTADDEKLGWNIHDSYAEGSTFLEGASYTNTSSAGSSSAGSLSIPQVSSSRSLRRSTVSSYAGAHGVSYGVAPTSSPNSSVTSSPMSSGGGLYATSSQTFKSFGSGNGGAAVGGGMRGGATMSNSSSPITYVSSGVGSFSSLPFSEGVGSSTSLPFRDGSGLGMSGDGSYAAAPASSSSLFGAYGDIYASTTIGSYNPMSSVYGGHGYAGVRGRQNAGFGDSWWVWLDSWVKDHGQDIGQGNVTDGYYESYIFDRATLEAAYNDFIEYWSANFGPENAPKFEEWLAWYQGAMGEHGYDYNGRNYNWLPIGNIVPLLIFAILYVMILIFRRRRLQVSE